MIEATCSACGTTNRIAEGDVPSGAAFVTCASCKARIAVPSAAATVASRKTPPPMPKPPGAKVPASLPSAGAKTDALDLGDLPAPKRQSPLGAVDLPAPKPAPKSALAGALSGGDLPAPKPKGSALDLDLMPAASAVDDGISDLPAPKATKRHPTPPPRPGNDLNPDSDLPAPRGAKPSIGPKSVAAAAPAGDLSGGRSGAARALTDLPTPADLDLPAPKSPLADLPAPKAPASTLKPPAATVKPAVVADLPAPKQDIELPAPKGFFDDLPQPAKKPAAAPAGEVAPKGFFDDLPQPAKKQAAAPAGEVAPKGFFDDLPQPAKKSSTDLTPSKKSSTDLAPKAAPPASPSAAAGPVPAPKGFFDDLAPPTFSAKEPIDLGGLEPLDLPDEPAALDLGAPLPPIGGPPAAAGTGSFDDLDLSAPTAPQAVKPIGEPPPPPDDGGGVKFTTPKAKPPGTPATPAATISKAALKSEPLSLELEGEKDKDTAAPVAKRPARAADARPDDAATARAKRKRTRIALGAVLVLALAGAGGTWFYKRHAAQAARAEQIESGLASARRALASDTPDRWQRAVTASQKVLEVAPKHGEALGISAEASLAGAMADGKNAAARIAKGRKHIADALEAGVVHPTLDRAQALATITSNPEAAPARLEAMTAKQPKDATLAVYLGWAHEAAGDLAKAIAAYDRGLAGPNGVKILALLGRGRAKLASGDLEGATADFQAVYDLDNKNIPAQIGRAAARPVTDVQQQENDLLALLSLKEIESADPRAVVQAWTLAAEIARNAGRLDEARDRYRKGLKINDKDVGAMVGLAEVELRDGKLVAAAELIGKALVQNKDYIPAQIVQADLAVREGKVDEATTRIDALEKREPPLPPLELSRVGVLRGKLLELGKDDAGAVEAYIAAAKLAGERDLTPTMLAVNKLSEMAKAETDPTKAAALRARADELLSELSSAAEKDPKVAGALGLAYFQAGQPAKAEPWLRKLAEARPTDPDAQYQLGRVLRAQGKGIEAVSFLEKAAGLAPERAEIGLELARTFELLNRDSDAGKAYEKLLAAGEPTLELRSHAGEFFVRMRQLDKAGEQGKKILEAEPRHPAGLYLKGEGDLAAGRLDDARRAFLEASDAERSAKNLDAVGRATESIAMLKGKDYLALQEGALRSYTAAYELDPKLFSSLLGMGRLHVARREMTKAVNILLEADRVRSNDAEVAYLLGVAYAELGTKDTKKAGLAWLTKSMGLKQDANTAYRLGMLYTDVDINQERQAIANLAIAVDLAEKQQRAALPLPEWYAEATFQLGNLANQVGDERRACEAWKRFKGTNPPPGPKTKEVDHILATSLKTAC